MSLVDSCSFSDSLIVVQLVGLVEMTKRCHSSKFLQIDSHEKKCL